jgi:molybdopterin/thiamine biosynthesis adenylyltransferase
MTSIDYWRQLDFVRPERLGFPITVVGVGGIGSPVALALAKMGCRRLTVYDPDRVEAHNLPNQLYRLRDVGRPKVEALAELLADFATIEVQAIPEAVDGQRLEGMVIAAVDSMAARQRIWRGSVRYRGTIPLYVDARMGGQVCRVLTVRPADPDQVRRYEATLYSDEAAVEDPCTAQAIVYTTFGVAALVANQVKRHAQDEPIEPDLLFDFATLTLITGVPDGG